MPIEQITSQFEEVELFVVTSVKNHSNIEELFQLGQKHARFPVRVLYDHTSQKLKKKYVSGLKRIFRICDRDKQELMTDQNLSEFNHYCFSVPLSTQDVTEIKGKISQEQIPNAVTQKGITLAGYLAMNHLFINTGQFEVNWKVLHRFGYGEDLQLRPSYLNPDIGLKPEHTCELSTTGEKFFTEMFVKFDKDQDGALSPEELEKFFATAPVQPWAPNTFPKSARTNEKGFVTLQGFLAQWSMTTFLDHKKTVNYLAYLGYDYWAWCASNSKTKHNENERQLLTDVSKAIDIRRGHKFERKRKRLNRNIFHCYVLGSPGCGKTAFLNSMLGKSFDEHYVTTQSSMLSVDALQIDGSQKYLVLEEFSSEEILSQKEKMERCDLVCLLYDTHDPTSFAYVAKIQKILTQKYPYLPTEYFETKSDLPPVKQSFEVTVQEFLAPLKISPKRVSSKKGVEHDIYVDILRKIFSKYRKSGAAKWLGFGFAVLVVAASAAGIYYLMKKSKRY